ncbi:MAG: DUF4861 domain-containing protein [Bacteroidales bacterium]|nr:DUF4861 domain-containing protein [Bacteroidales bacterium]MDD5891535.1 DUF4861 family protein [Bacteroidales bacterium]
MKRFFLSALLLFCFAASFAQTASSLFLRSDSLQVKEIVSKEANRYKDVGHHGPAVENSHMALRLYFNDSGAIDLYSKSGRGMELLKYKWYPTQAQQDSLGTGCDEYMVGKTVGFGGIALWDGEKEVKLKATKGRTARVWDSSKGSFAELIAYGVEYMGDTVDVSITVSVTQKNREAKVTARELSGKKVMFLTGVNYHPGEKVVFGENFISVWGIHPANVSTKPIPVGAGMKFNPKKFNKPEKTDNMVRIVSLPASSISTTLVGASVKEAELNSARRFEEYLGRK